MVKRWDDAAHDRVEAPDVDRFLADLVAVCRRHNMSLGHEDGHCSFEVVRGFDETYADWLMKAAIAQAH